MNAAQLTLAVVASWVAARLVTRLQRARNDLRDAIGKAAELQVLIRSLAIRAAIALTVLVVVLVALSSPTGS